MAGSGAPVVQNVLNLAPEYLLYLNLFLHISSFICCLVFQMGFSFIARFRELRL